MDFQQLKKIIEAAVLTSEVPVSVEQLKSLFDENDKAQILDIERALLEMERDCDNRGVELKKIGGGYRYQSREEFADWLRRLSEIRPRRYSRALMETLSIIAFRQPVTRGDILSLIHISEPTRPY